MARLQLTEKRKDQFLNLALVGSLCLLLSGFLQTARRANITTPQPVSMQAPVLAKLSQPSLRRFDEVEKLNTEQSDSAKAEPLTYATVSVPSQQTSATHKDVAEVAPNTLGTTLSGVLNTVVDTLKIL